MKIFDAIAWLVIVNFALYFKTLGYKFVSDDFTVWRNPPIFKNPWHKAWLRFIGAAKTMSVSYHFLNVNGKKCVALVKTEEMEHLIALLIHVAICVSIYFAFGHNNVGFVTAMLYSVNPINNQGTMWPGGRGYALPILSLMLAMSIPILSPFLLYFCSWFTIGFLAPLCLIGSPKWYLLGTMPIVWFLHSRKFKKAITLKSQYESFYYDKQMDFNKAVVFVKTYGFYLILCVFPFRVTFYHNFLQSLAGNELMREKAWARDRYFWFGLCALIGTAVLAVTHWGPLAWALLAFFITIAPFGNVVRANQEIAERFAALPNVFLMYAVALLIQANPVLVACFLTFYASRTYYTLIMYKDEYWITEVAVMEDPFSWWAWHCRAMKRWSMQSYKEAMTLWVMALMISPKEFKLLINLASCLRILNNHQEAELYLTMAQANMVKGQEENSLAIIAEHRKGKLPILL